MQKITLHCRFHSTAPQKATKVPNAMELQCAILKIMGHAILCNKVHSVIKYLVAVIDEVEVHIQVL